MNHSQVAYSADIFTHESWNQVRLWDAIDAYVRACGGEPGRSFDKDCPRIRHINSLVTGIASDAIYGYHDAMTGEDLNPNA